MAAPLERLEKGDGPPTPNRARVVEFTVRATSLVVKATAAAVVFILVLGLILILNLLLSDAYTQLSWPHAYTQLSWPLVYGAFFAFLSQLSSIGKGFQKAGVQALPELSLRRSVLWQYLQSRQWRTGLILDVCGAIFGLISLTILPISIAQPIFCNGLVLLALYSHVWLDEHLGRREWVSIALCFVGTVLLAVTLVPRDWRNTDIRWIQVKLSLAMLVALPSLVVLELGGRSAKRNSADSSSVELLAGLQAGMCIGVGNAAIATGLQSTSRSWRAHLNSSSPTPHMRAHLALSAAFVLCGAALNGAHPIFANRGYQQGRVLLISTYTSLVSMGTGVFIGIVVLDESWPSAPRMSLLRQFSFLLLFWGVLTLNGHRLSASLSRRSRTTHPNMSSGNRSASHISVCGTRHKRHASDGVPPITQQQVQAAHGQMPHGQTQRKVAVSKAGRDVDT